MNASNIAASPRARQEQTIARLLAELRFDDNALAADLADGWVLIPPQPERPRASSASSGDEEDWISLIGALMPPATPRAARAAAAYDPAAGTTATSHVAQTAEPRKAAHDRAPAPPTTAPAVDGTQLLEVIWRDGVRVGRFADGSELEVAGVDERGQPVFLGPRDSVPTLLLSLAAPIVALGGLTVVVAHFQIVAGVVSGILPSIAPMFGLW